MKTITNATLAAVVTIVVLSFNSYFASAQFPFHLGADSLNSPANSGNSITKDASGNVYIIGALQGTVDMDPSTNTNTLTSLATAGDGAFVAKYDATGAYQWSFVLRGLGGSGVTDGYGITSDGTNIYITGSFKGLSVNFKGTSGAAVNLTSVGTSDINAFVAKYNAAGANQWAFGIGVSTKIAIGNGIATDGTNVYVTGSFSGTNVNFKGKAPTAHTLTALGTSDIFVAAYACSSGNWVWAFNAGITGSAAVGKAIATNGTNVYVTGSFGGASVDFKGTSAGPNTLTSNGSTDIFVGSYSAAAGAYQWAFNTGSSTADVGNGIVTDGTNVYVTGSFTGTADFKGTSAGPNSLTETGGGDIFVASYSASAGAYQWAFNMGSAGADAGKGIALDASSNVYVTGSFTGTADFKGTSGGPNNLTEAGGGDIFVAKYNSSGAYQWVFNTGSATADVGNGIAIDGSGNVLGVGNFTGTANFKGTSAGPNNLGAASGGNAIFVSKYNSSGAYQWAFNTVPISSSVTSGISTTMDANKNVYVTGTYQGTVDFDPSAGTAYLVSGAGATANAFVAKYDANGVFQWAFGVPAITTGGTTSSGNGITVDASGNVYVTGGFTGTCDFKGTSAGPNTLISNGSNDIFVAKYNSAGAYQWAFSVGDVSADQGNSIATDANGNVYVGGVFEGTADFDPSAGTASLTAVGVNDFFVAKYNSSGAYQWAFNNGISGGGETTVNSIVVNKVDNSILIAGRFDNGTLDLDPSANTNNVTSTGTNDGFVVKYDGNSNPSSTSFFKWAFHLGSGLASAFGDASNAIAIDISGNVYVAGTFNNDGSTAATVDFDPSTGTANLTGPTPSGSEMQDFYIAKYDGTNLVTGEASNGSGPVPTYKWALVGSELGAGSLTKTISGIATDGINVYVTGIFSTATDFDPSGSVASLTPISTDNFLGSYSASTGSYQAVFDLGATGGGQYPAITADACGNMVVAGSFKGTVDFDLSAGVHNLLAHSTGGDAYVAKYSPSFTSTYATSSVIAPVAIAANNTSTGQFNANWNSAVNASGYYLDVSTSNTFNSFISGYNNFNVGNVTTYLVTGLPSGTYYYRVRAFNGCSPSPTYSNTISVSATCPTMVGGTVTPVTSVVCSAGSQLLTVAGAVGGTLQWQSSTDNVSWSDIGGQTNTTYSAIPTQKTYYRSISINTVCYNASSTTAIIDVSATPSVSIVGLTSTSATITWSPYGSGQDNISWSEPLPLPGASGSAAAVTSNFFTISGLNPDGDVSITVTPANACPSVNPLTVSTHVLCDKPIMTNLVATVYHGFTATWSAVAGATSYRLFYRDLSTSASWSFKDVTTTTATVSVLYGSHTFAVYVAANNCASSLTMGDGSAPILYVTTAPLSTCAPGATTVSAVSTCPNQISVSMSGGSGVYAVTFRRISPGVTAGATYTITGNLLNLNVGTQYAGTVWEVYARSVCSPGVYSDISNIVEITVKQGYGQIPNLVLSHPTCHGFTASWNADNTVGITNYEVLIKKSTVTGYNAYPSANNYFIANFLQTNTTYNVIVESLSCNGATSVSSTMLTISTSACRDENDESASDINNPDNSIDNKEAVLIYPNPTARQFWVNIGSAGNTAATTIKIELVNQLGQVMQTDLSEMNSGYLNQLVNTPIGIATGIYFVRTSVGSNVYVNKLMIVNE